MLNDNGKRLLDFVEDNKLPLLNNSLCTLKSGMFYTFESTKRSKGQTFMDYILIKQTDLPLVFCVNVRRPPLEAPESDHNLVYAKVRIPRRSALNRKKRDCTKETPKTADLRWLMTDPNLRCQVANAIVTVQPQIPDDTCISDITTNMADVIHSTVAELAPRSKRLRGAQDWFAGPSVDAEMNGVWQEQEEARTHLRVEPHSSNLQKAVKMTETNIRKVRKAAVLSFSWDFVRKPETRARQDDQAGFCKHLMPMNLEEKRERSSAYAKDEDGILLRDVELIRERWVRWLYTLVNTKSPKLGLNIGESLGQWPEDMPLGEAGADRRRPLFSERKGFRSDRTESPVSNSKSPSTVIPPCARDCLISPFEFGGGARCRGSENMSSSWYSI